MSYSTDPVYDAARYYDALSARQAREGEYRAYWAAEWVDGALRDTTRPATWMPRDCWESEGGHRRPQTMAESMQDMLDYQDFAMRAMDVLAVVARTNPTARKLLEDMGKHWAEVFAPELEDD